MKIWLFVGVAERIGFFYYDINKILFVVIEMKIWLFVMLQKGIIKKLIMIYIFFNLLL